MCKADYIQCVKVIMSTGARARAPWQASAHPPEIHLLCWSVQDEFASAAVRPKQVDIFLFWYIIYITDGLCQRCQTPPSPPTGRLAPPPRSGHCRTVPGQQFLRSRRFDPGQIRDAATGRGRTDPGQPGSARSRTLAALVLSSSGSHATKRSDGIDSAKTRTARRAQANGSSTGFFGSTAEQPTPSEVRRVGPAGSKTTGCDGSPTHDRTGAIPASKKTP